MTPTDWSEQESLVFSKLDDLGDDIKLLREDYKCTERKIVGLKVEVAKQQVKSSLYAGLIAAVVSMVAMAAKLLMS